MGIRACSLRHKEPRPKGNDKKAGGGWHGGDEGGSSGEDEVIGEEQSRKVFEFAVVVFVLLQGLREGDGCTCTYINAVFVL